MNASNEFLLYGDNDAFADRQKKLFDQLSIAEKECNKARNGTGVVPMDVDSLTPDDGRHPTRNVRKRKSEMRQFRGKESIFKRPEGPAPRQHSRSIPDHHRNPHKWMKYSLDDVSTDDMTDRSNAKTAFAFLKELKARRAREDAANEKDPDSPTMDRDRDSLLASGGLERNLRVPEQQQSTGIEFKRPEVPQSKSCRNSVEIVESEQKPIFLSSKVVMPEYVVGQKPKKKKDREKRRGTAGKNVLGTKELKLNHLEEFYDDEDETI